MRFRVQYTAQLRTVVGRAEEEIELPEGCNLAAVLVHVAQQLRREAAPYLLAASGDVQPSLLVAVNHTAVAPSEAGTRTIREGDIVMLMPPIAGG